MFVTTCGGGGCKVESMGQDLVGEIERGSGGCCAGVIVVYSR